MTNILNLARSHVEALRNYRIPREPIGTIAILDGLIAEIERLKAELDSEIESARNARGHREADNRESKAEIERLRSERESFNDDSIRRGILINSLARVLLKNFGDPKNDESPCGMAIRVLTDQFAEIEGLRAAIETKDLEIGRLNQRHNKQQAEIDRLTEKLEKAERFIYSLDPCPKCWGLETTEPCTCTTAARAVNALADAKIIQFYDAAMSAIGSGIGTLEHTADGWRMDWYSPRISRREHYWTSYRADIRFTAQELSDPTWEPVAQAGIFAHDTRQKLNKWNEQDKAEGGEHD